MDYSLEELKKDIQYVLSKKYTNINTMRRASLYERVIGNRDEEYTY